MQQTYSTICWTTGAWTAAIGWFFCQGFSQAFGWLSRCSFDLWSSTAVSRTPECLHRSCGPSLFGCRGQMEGSNKLMNTRCNPDSKCRTKTHTAFFREFQAPHTQVCRKAPQPFHLVRSSLQDRNLWALASPGLLCRSSLCFQAWGLYAQCRICVGTKCPEPASRRFPWLCPPPGWIPWAKDNQTNQSLPCSPGLCSSSPSFKKHPQARWCSDAGTSSTPLFLCAVKKLRYASCSSSSLALPLPFY